ncbi:SID1 transmembrane family member 1, partial [Eurytemora carolleeae]|uniref:SID1 transmembrane family member 1 n=1 Tax=Eurytemora carolleeae TaxID=1294199 RepID=UPI000C790C40
MLNRECIFMDFFDGHDIWHFLGGSGFLVLTVCFPRITGNQDICYYNDLCRRPLGVIRDFNHVFSNLGYCVFGILFMLIVYLKKWKYTTFFQDNKTIQEVEYGVPQQYGIYFSMGLALFMEGVMSGSYHVCPTNITFQFDTTFMYLMCILMFLKLYQVRHADVSANAVGVFFGLGVSLILETVSIFYSGPWFWAFFCTVSIYIEEFSFFKDQFVF